MGKETNEVGSTSDKNTKIHPEESNNLQSKIVGKNESDFNENHTIDPSALNMNVDQVASEKCYHKEDVVPLPAGTSASSSRPKRRCNPVTYGRSILRPLSPEGQPSGKKMKMKLVKPGTAGTKSIGADDEVIDLSREFNHTVDDILREANIPNPCLKDSSDNENCKNNVMERTSSAAVALEKLKFDITINPNAEDRYTDSGFTSEGSTPESPETQKQRIDIISRQCRLHPANKKYNQGPVENPPPITPGKMVGYTPGGQRHEVDLNFDRPNWFNSEYARMQWDYATRVNVSRMFHDLETGMFLADGLDPNIERRHFAEQEMASKQANEHFQEIAKASSSHANIEPVALDWSEAENQHYQLLEAENELIDLNKYAVVRIQDFAGEINQKLRKALDLPLTPLMIKKNPVILDTLETLATQCIHIEVVLAARALLDKIKGMFQVPENQEFSKFFAEEVEKLKKNTRHMSGFDILMLTEEPPDTTDDTESLADTLSVSSQSEGEPDLRETEEDWVPVENGDIWVDSLPDSNYISYANSEIGSDNDLASITSDDGDNDWTSNNEDEDSSLSYENHSDDNLEVQIQDLNDLLGTLISGAPEE